MEMVTNFALAFSGSDGGCRASCLRSARRSNSALIDICTKFEFGFTKFQNEFFTQNLHESLRFFKKKKLKPKTKTKSTKAAREDCPSWKVLRILSGSNDVEPRRTRACPEGYTSCTAYRFSTIKQDATTIATTWRAIKVVIAIFVC